VLWRIPDSKTPAGVRTVEITAFTANEFRVHVAQKKLDGRPCGPGDPMWVSSKGPCAEKAKMLLPAVTPHTLRRTFACICF
jgi:integrase